MDVFAQDVLTTPRCCAAAKLGRLSRVLSEVPSSDLRGSSEPCITFSTFTGVQYAKNGKSQTKQSRQAIATATKEKKYAKVG